MSNSPERDGESEESSRKHCPGAISFWRRYGRAIAAAAIGGLAVYAALRIAKALRGAPAQLPNSPFDVPGKPPKPGTTSTNASPFEFAARCVDKKNLRSDTWQSNIASQSIRCGEDSFFVSMAAFGVADGVGGWARHGVSAKHFSQGLADHGMDEARAAESRGSAVDPAAILHAADMKTKRKVEAGSSTACFGAIGTDRVLRVVNVGDSGVVVVRGRQVVFQADETNHGFNYPKQLGSFPNGGRSDKAADGWQGSFQLIPNDVVIAATDGVFDNVRTTDLANIAYHTVGDGRKKGTGPDVGMAATDIVTKACREANSESGSWGSKDASGVGGKPDDITVVVMRVLGEE